MNHMRNLTAYERKKLLDIKLNDGSARNWNSEAESFDEYLDAMDIPKTTEVLFSPYKNKFTDAEAFIAHYRETHCDFVYDAKSETFYTDFSMAHVDFIANLYLKNGGVRQDTIYEAMDAFVYTGMGIFKSRAGTTVLASDKFVLPESLWYIRRDLEFI